MTTAARQDVVAVPPRLPARSSLHPPPYTLTAVASAWIAGVLLAAFLPSLQPNLAGWFLLAALLCLIALWLGWPDARTRWAALLLCAFLLGLARCVAALPVGPPEEGSLRRYNATAEAADRGLARVIDVRGVIVEGPLVLDATRARLEVEATGVLSDSSWLPVHGALLAHTGRYTSVQQGDLVIVRGILQDAPRIEDFDYATYLLRRGIGSYMQRASVELLVPGYAAGAGAILAEWRAAAGERIERQMPQPAAGLLRGILLGEQRAIDPDLLEDFRVTGTAHLLAISGGNMTLLMGFLFFATRGSLGLRRSVILTLLVLFGYAYFVVFGWPVWRAAFMAALYLCAKLLGRPVTGHSLIAFTALVFTVLDPLAIADIGFQLSFAAMVGLTTAGPLVERWLSGRSWIWQASAMNLVFLLFTSPIFAFHFEEISIIAALANLLVAELLAPVMALGLLHAVAGFIEPLAQVVAWTCWLLLSLMIVPVQLLAQSPITLLPLPHFDLFWLTLWYCVLAVALLWLRRQLYPPVAAS